MFDATTVLSLRIAAEFQIRASDRLEPVSFAFGSWNANDDTARLCRTTWPAGRSSEIFSVIRTAYASGDTLKCFSSTNGLLASVYLTSVGETCVPVHSAFAGICRSERGKSTKNAPVLGYFACSGSISPRWLVLGSLRYLSSRS